MKAHEAIIHLLDAAGVDTVFGLMSEDTMEFMSEIHENWDDDIRLVQSRHEQGAMAMADGYSRATGRIGVCVVGRGPAIAQTGTSLVTSRKQGSKLLVVVPEPPLTDDYDIKEFEQETYLRSTVGNVVSIRSHDTLVSDFEEAVRRVRIGDGPVAVQVPWDVFDSEMDVPDGLSDRVIAPESSEPSGARLQPDDDEIEAAVDLFLDSDAFQPPIILAGQGAVRADAKDAMEELAERTSGLLATSLQARGYFDDHPFSLGFIGSWGNNLANEYFIESDYVLAVGCSLSPYTLDSGYLLDDEKKVVHIDTDPASIERYTPVDIGILGDARITVEAITRELERQGIDRGGELWSDDLRDRIANHSPLEGRREFPEQPGTMDPRELVGTLNEVLPEDRLVVTDGGHFTRWVMDGIRTHPDDFVFSLDFAAIGQGLSMGIGAARAADEQSCVTVCGDAGFMMAIQEVETAARNDIPVTVIVMNDSSLGSEYHNLAEEGEYAEAALIPTPDFADVAEAFGADGYTVRSLDELEELEDVLGRKPSGPVVVDCKVNHEVRHRSKM